MFERRVARMGPFSATDSATVSVGPAKLVDAPDLELRNHRFQNIALRFKTDALYERKTANLLKSCSVANGE
jgi:hypothetical protein